MKTFIKRQPIEFDYDISVCKHIRQLIEFDYGADYLCLLFHIFTEEPTKYPDIKVSEFLTHVRALHADSDNGFSNEFEDITSHTRTDLMAEASYQPENKAKNRYVNISACEYM